MKPQAVKLIEEIVRLSTRTGRRPLLHYFVRPPQLPPLPPPRPRHR